MSQRADADRSIPRVACISAYSGQPRRRWQRPSWSIIPDMLQSRERDSAAIHRFHDKSMKESEPLQATSLTPRILPHLRRLTGVGKYECGNQHHVQPSDQGKNKLVDDITSLSHDSTLTRKEDVQAVATSAAFVRPDSGFDAWLDSRRSLTTHSVTTWPL